MKGHRECSARLIPGLKRTTCFYAETARDYCSAALVAYFVGNKRAAHSPDAEVEIGSDSNLKAQLLVVADSTDRYKHEIVESCRDSYGTADLARSTVVFEVTNFDYPDDPFAHCILASALQPIEILLLDAGRGLLDHRRRQVRRESAPSSVALRGAIG